MRTGGALSREELELSDLLEQQAYRRRRWEIPIGPTTESEALERMEESERRMLLERQYAAAKRRRRRE